jgi:hypothetical protein
MNPLTRRRLHEFVSAMRGHAIVLRPRVDMPPALRNVRLAPAAPWLTLWTLIGTRGMARIVATRRYP